jgi:trehalose/maltose hydrolase-like predicted phosphorylase
VIPPDESADHGVDNSVFTNYVAKRNLLFAEEASQF